MTFGSGGSFNLGSAYAEIILDASGVDDAVAHAQRAFEGGITSISQHVQSLGQQMTAIGTSIEVLTGPLAAGFGVAVNSAMSFEEAMTNIQAVTSATADETAALGDTLQNIGENSRFGAQAVAEAYYDIAGGVTDASVRMDLLNAAVLTAQAGNADLTATTQALISVMNSYGFAAEQAGFASDVLTRTVGMGVGTMDQFAAALPTVTGLANSMGVSFDDLAAATAYLTTQGNTAAQATTQIGSMMSALLNPSNDMRDALRALGFESGRAAVQELGLVGTYQALAREFGIDAIGPLVGRMEGMRGVTALLGEDFAEFSTTFAEGIDGATASAEAIQMQSAAAQFDLLRSSLGSLAIEVGQVLLPALIQMVDAVRPVIESVIDWVQANPELVAGIGILVTTVAGLGAVLIAGGIAFGAIGTLIGALFSPIGLVIGAIALLALAFETNFGGIRDAVQPILDRLGTGISYFFEGMSNGLGPLQALGASLTYIFGPQVAQAVVDFINGFLSTLGTVATFITTTVVPALTTFANWFITDVLPVVVSFVTDTVAPAIGGFFEGIGTFWTNLQPTLQAFADWFITDALPTVVTFITDTVAPAVNGFFEGIGDFWADIQPGLASFADWFTTDALPLVTQFINDVAAPAFQLISDVVGGIWALVEPGLTSFFNWFTADALPVISSFLSDTVIPIVGDFIDLLAGIWTVAGVGLTELHNWWSNTFIGSWVDSITGTNGIQTVLQGFIDVATAIWDTISPAFTALYNWISTNLPGLITNFIQPLGDSISRIVQGAIDAVESLLGIGNAATGGGTPVQGGVAPGGDYSQSGSEYNRIDSSSISGTGGFGGFAGGGFTGTGDSSEVAGVVHRNEYVVPENGALVMSGGGDTYQIQVSVPLELLRNEPQLESNARTFGEFMMDELTRQGMRRS